MHNKMFGKFGFNRIEIFDCTSHTGNLQTGLGTEGPSHKRLKSEDLKTENAEY